MHILQVIFKFGVNGRMNDPAENSDFFVTDVYVHFTFTYSVQNTKNTHLK